MHNKRLYKKLMTLLDWFLLLLPLILFIGYIIVNQHLSTEISFNEIITGFNSLFGNLTYSNLFDLFVVFIQKISGLHALSPVLTSICLYCVYIVIVVLIDIVRDLLLLIPTWFNNMLDK